MHSILLFAQDTIAVVFQNVTTDKKSSDLTPEQQFSLIIGLGAPLIALGGTITVTILSPWINRRKEKRKAREEIKASIIKNTHIFFNYTKRLVEALNNNGYRAKTLYNMDDAVRSGTEDPENIKDERNRILEKLEKTNSEIHSFKCLSTMSRLARHSAKAL